MSRLAMFACIGLSVVALSACSESSANNDNPEAKLTTQLLAPSTQNPFATAPTLTITSKSCKLTSKDSQKRVYACHIVYDQADEYSTHSHLEKKHHAHPFPWR